MKKILVKIGIAVLAILLILVVVFSVAGGSILKTGIEAGASKALNVGVSLDKASLALFAGKVGLKGLVVNNPDGYESPNMLDLGSAAVDVGVGSLLSDTVVIEDMKFDNITLMIEQKGLTNNLQEVINSLPTKDAGETKTEDESAGKKLNITNLEITNINVKVKLLPVTGMADTITFPLDSIQMQNLGSESKLDVAALTAKILSALAAGVAKQGIDFLPIEMIGPLSSKLKEQGVMLIESGKEALEGVGDILDEGKDIGEGIKKGIEGIFKKKDE